MTDPNDPYAPPAPPSGPAHPQVGATQPLPMNPSSSGTPFDPPQPPAGPPAPGYQSPTGHQAPPMQPYAAASPYAAPSPYPYAAPSPYPYPAPSPYPYPARRTNGMAIAALVLGVLWLYWLGSILALVFGYVALGQIKRAPADAPQEGRGIALAGVILGWVGVAMLAAMVMLLTFVSTTSAGY